MCGRMLAKSVNVHMQQRRRKMRRYDTECCSGWLSCVGSGSARIEPSLCIIMKFRVLPLELHPKVWTKKNLATLHWMLSTLIDNGHLFITLSVYFVNSAVGVKQHIARLSTASKICIKVNSVTDMCSDIKVACQKWWSHLFVEVAWIQ